MFGVSENSIRNWKARYAFGGVAGLESRRPGRKAGVLRRCPPLGRIVPCSRSTFATVRLAFRYWTSSCAMDTPASYLATIWAASSAVSCFFGEGIGEFGEEGEGLRKQANKLHMSR